MTDLDNALDWRAPVDLLANLVSASELLATDFPPVEYVVPGIIPEGCTLLVAPPKIGKSWFVLGVALAAVTGGRALGVLPVDRRPVLYLALEDGHRRLKSRLERIGVDAAPDGLDFLTVVPSGLLLDTVAAYLDLHGAEKPLVLLDTLGKAMPPQAATESTYQRDYRTVGRLKELVDAYPGSSLVLVHHTRKAETTDFLDAVSGTQGLAGAADTVALIKRDRQESEAVLHVTSRDAAEGSYKLTFDAGVWTLAGEDLAEAARAADAYRQSAGVGDRMAEVIDLASRHPDGIRRADVAAELGMSPEDATQYLNRAAKAGRLVKPSRGLFAVPTPLSCLSSVSSLQEEHDTDDEHDTPLAGHARHVAEGNDVPGCYSCDLDAGRG